MAAVNERQRLLIFGSIGAFNTGLDVSLFLGLRHLGLPILIANIISTSIALLGSYFLNKRFTFEAGKNSRHTLPLFLVVTLAGLWILQPIVIKLVLLILHTSFVARAFTTVITRPQHYFELIAKLSATPPTLIWNYVLYKRVVFKKQPVGLDNA